MRFLATALLLGLSGSLLPGPGGVAPSGTQDLIGDPVGFRRYSVGVDTWEVWICHLTGTTDLTSDDASRVLTRELTPYFEELSAGHYQPRFVPAGSASASELDDRYPCEVEIERRTPGTADGAIVISNELNIPRAFALVGRIAISDFDRFPDNGRVIRIGAHAVLPEAWNFEPKRIAHEIGHAIGWPHSFSGLREDASQYDNPLDVMSATLSRNGPLRGRPQGTLAVNRLAAGWLRHDQIAVASEPRAVYRIAPLGGPGTQLVLVPIGEPGILMALDVRLSRSYDSGIRREGVAVHLIDERPSACGLEGGCFGPRRRTQPLLTIGQASPEYDHVLTVGDSVVYFGHRVEVTDRLGDGFLVEISTLEN